MERLLARAQLFAVLLTLLLSSHVHAVYSPTADTELPAATQVNADNNSAPTAPAVYSYQMCFDGANWDRCSGQAVDTELPVAVALADNTANPTVPGVAAFMMCFDGANWDRCLPGISDTDDNSIAFSQITTLAIDLPHMSDGSKWIRQFGTAANGLTVDQANTAELDYDTGAGTVLQTMVGIALPASGGPVAGGTVTNPFSISGSITCSNCSGTGVSVNEDVPSANADPGTPAYSVRQTTLSTTTSADGDYQPLKSNDNGELYTSAAIRGAIPTGANVIGALTANQSVNLNQLAGSSIQQATNAMNTTGGGLPVVQNACQLDVTSPTATTENQFGNVRCSSIGELYGIIRDAAGNARGANVTAANELLVSLNTAIPTGANTIGTVNIGTMPATGTEDLAYSEGSTGLVFYGVRRDVPASSSNASGDLSTFNFNQIGSLWTSTIDPCSSTAKLFVAINQTTGTQLFTGTASNRTYVCSVHLVTATTQNIALVSGTGTVCATGTHAIAGGTSAATGWNLSANGGLVVGDGSAAIGKSTTDADNICVLQSASGQISGTIAYAVAPN